VSANKYTLFTDVHSFYTDMLKVLETAQEQISLIYFTFDSGEWSGKFARVLSDRAAAGVRVRLLVDDVGLAIDTPKNIQAVR
jgi:phosphatidylserine/phosphatidylglycerophosphate/cardiolipin synthase-like enzyme